MERRKFLQSTGGLAALAVTPATEPSPSAGVSAGYAADQGDFPTDSYQMPDWLHYARTVYFDGYSPPVYPHPKDFDAKRLLQTVVEIGGNLLRFQPIGYWAYYPSKAFRVHPELGGRDLIDEVAREARRVGVHFFGYTGYGHPHMELGWIGRHPEYADWVLRGPDGRPYRTYWHIGWANRQRLCSTGDAYRAGFAKSSGNYVNMTRTECISTHRAASVTREFAFVSHAGRISGNSAAWTVPHT